MKKESIVLRVVLIAGMVFALLIPLVMIQSLIDERQQYRDEAVNEVNKSWSGSQVTGGLVLNLQYDTSHENQHGETYTSTKTKNILPENLLIDCALIPEIRYKGIYEVVLYRSRIKASGFFQINQGDFPAGAANSKYNVFINLSDLRGIEDSILFKWNGKTQEVIPGISNADVFRSGVSVTVDSLSPGKYHFDIEVQLKGSDGISFIPVGKSTKVTVSSVWNNPSFTGAFLPSNRVISENSFKAVWNINYFNRDYPQKWEGSGYNISGSAFGVRLLMPVDEYQKSMRTSKYGILIVLLTFVSFFMIEIFSKKVLHPVQYLLVGLSLVIFYSALLALSEYILFDYAYIISALFIIALITLYVKTAYNSIKLGAIIALLLLVFYSFMYVILQLQDYSLLLGTIALFITLAVIMYLTRKINWFDIFANKAKQGVQ